MPLATICGLPASGKTTFAEGLVAFLRNELGEARRVVLVNEEGVRIGKHEGYRDAAAEKETRGSLRAAVDHALNAKTVVVLDSLNYIKGFRYQLYCAARAESTQHCVVWVETGDQALSREWNAAREDAYPEGLFDDLWNRFEAPNAANRWDRPLIRYRTGGKAGEAAAAAAAAGSAPVSAATAASTEGGGAGEAPAAAGQGVEAAAESGGDVEAVYRQVLAALMDGRAPAAGLSTVVAQRAEADALYLLDQVTQKVVASLLDRQATAMAGDRLQLAEASRPFLLSRRVGLPELKRLRRQFVKQAQEWNAAVWKQREGRVKGEQGGLSREVAIADAFLDYVGTQLD